jgi:phage replication O-like protein O
MPYGEGSPQLGDGYTRIANEILEALAHTDLTGSESRCIFFLWRKTYGWIDKKGQSKKEDTIAYSQWADGTGLDRRCLIRILDGLAEKHILTKTPVTRPGRNPATVWAFQKKYNEWKGFHEAKLVSFQPLLDIEVVAPVTPVTSQVVTTTPPVSHQVVTTGAQSSGAGDTTSSGAGATNNRYSKDTITKDTITPIVPKWLKKEVWDAFIEMRKKMKAPATDLAIKLIIGKLEKLKEAGDEPNEVLEQSIMNNWKGIFALKNKSGGNNGAHQGPSSASTGHYTKTEELPLD